MPSLDDGMIQVTSSGKSGLVYNGVPDWLYGEKILESNRALWFSPGGSRLVYASFDDTKVASIDYPVYGMYDDPSNIYPETASVKYPKAGKANPLVTLFVVDLMSEEITSNSGRGISSSSVASGDQSRPLNANSIPVVTLDETKDTIKKLLPPQEIAQRYEQSLSNLSFFPCRLLWCIGCSKKYKKEMKGDTFPQNYMFLLFRPLR